MKIFIFAHAVRAGGGRATCTNILNALKKVDKENNYCMVVPDQPEYRALNLEHSRCNVHYYRRKFGDVGRLWFDWVTLKQMVRRYHPDVVWGMGNTGLISPTCPQAISVQHPHLVYDREITGPSRNLRGQMLVFLLRRSFSRALSQTGVVFCQTTTMADRIRDLYGYRGNIVVTSKQMSTFATSTTQGTPDRLSLINGRFTLFYVSRYYRHKGLEMLVEVMDRYRDELSDTVAVITIEAGQHPAAARLLKKIERHGLKDRVINVGRLAPGELAAYYGACDALVMPTCLESFSGTYLEAMHFGLPILTSDLDFAREVCGDAALYFDPWDAESIRNAILRLKNDPQLRRDLAARGKTRLSTEFTRTWEDIARTIKETLEQLVQSERERASAAVETR